MSNRNFIPVHWLQGEHKHMDLSGREVLPQHQSLSSKEKKLASELMPNFTPVLPDLPPLPGEAALEHEGSNNPLSRFFTKGWNPEGLISKSAIEFKQVISVLTKDAKAQLFAQTLNKSLRKSIYREFLLFAESRTLACEQLDDTDSFWLGLKDANHPHRNELNQFLDSYTIRLVTIYFYKLRFAKVLSKSTERPISWKELFYPGTFINEIFKYGSSLALKSKALESNVFSWYTPSKNLDFEISKLAEVADELTVGEMSKCLGPLLHGDHQTEHPIFAHALSHKHFGLFMNSLLINMGTWMGHNTDNDFSGSKISGQEIISCKIQGDYLESLGQSHWLAQENNKYLNWQQILCPDFKGSDFFTGKFLKHCQEFQLMTFLAQYASEHKLSVVKFICQVINGHTSVKKNGQIIQRDLLLEAQPDINSTYHRIVLNLAHFPKNNPHFYLVNQIIQQKPLLKDNGLLFVMSNKGLFVPSQKDKVDQLLKGFKLEAQINLEEVKGKGEVPNFIYVFSVRKDQNKMLQKESCLSFRFSADLDTFQRFSDLTDELQHFFRRFLKSHPPLFQKEFGKSFRLEFYQDVIVDGRLIQSSNKDTSQITHPSFFNNIMKSCVPLDYFFEIKSIDSIDTTQEFMRDDELLGLELDNQFVYPYVIIIDQRRPNETFLELIQAKSYKAKSYEYGFTQCHYFGLNPKRSSLNLNLFREYFASKMGKQLIELAFAGVHSKYKSNLSSLLIPRFMAENIPLPAGFANSLSTLKLQADQLTSCHPDQLAQQVDQSIFAIEGIKHKYPFAILSEMNQFTHQIDLAMDHFELGHQRGNGINFNNPIIKDNIAKLKAKAIYPDNSEIFIKFHLKGTQDINLPLTEVQISTNENLCAILYSRDQEIASIYAEWEQVCFIKFLLNNVKNVPIYRILQALQLPNHKELKQIIDQYKKVDKTLQEIKDKINQLKERILINNISQVSEQK